MHRTIYLLFFCYLLPLFPYQIIYLNGTSSVGKTTLAKALQNEMETPYLHVSFDHIIKMMPAKLFTAKGSAESLGYSWEASKDEYGYPLQLLHIGSYAAQMPAAFREIVLTLAKNGHRLIIDDVASEKRAFDYWRTALEGYNVLWVGLTAPLSVIEKREQERGNRRVGQARALAANVHNGFIYDLFFDTDVLKTEEIIQQIKQTCR